MAEIRYYNSYSLPGGFNITSDEPIDSRMYVADIQHIYSADNWVNVKPYPGLIVSDPTGEVRICVNSNFTLESSWKKIGNGAVSVDTYEEAVALATDDNIGQVIYVKTKSSYDADGVDGEAEPIEYEAAPYIVIGYKQLQKLAASSAGGNIQGDVAALTTKVSGLETRIVKAEGNITTNAEAIEDLAAEDTAIRSEFAKADEDLQAALEEQIEAKVAQTEYDAKVTEIGTTIAENDTKAKGYADTAKSEAISAAADDATTKANAAQAAAEATAAADAASKANTAEQNAKDYATGLNTNMAARVGALEAVKDDYKDADEKLKGEINAELAKKVNSEAGYRLMSESEGTKLAGIADGANVNVIETIKVDGVEITPDPSKAVNITLPSIPVKGVTNKNGQIITLNNEGNLDTTLNIVYVKANETTGAQLRLTGVNDEVISSFDATDFVKDGMVNDVKLTGPNPDETGSHYLEITWNTDSGKEVMRVDVSDLLNPYNAGNGLDLADSKFSIKLKANEQYLSVGTDGLSTTDALWNEVNRLDQAVLSSAAADATTKAEAAKNEAISTAAGDATTKAEAARVAAEAAAAADATSKAKTAKEEAIAAAAADATSKANTAKEEAIAAAAEEATTKANAAQAAAQTYADGLNTNMNTRVEALEAIDHDHENKEVLDGITANQVSAWDAAEQNAKDYADTTFVTKDGFNAFEEQYEEKLSNIEAGAQVNVIESVEVNGIGASIDGNKKASVKVQAKDIELGVAIKNGEDDKYGASDTISTVLQSIQESIRGAIAGGVNSVSSGDKAIIVNSADANNPVISLKVETSSEATVAAGHVELIKSDNGLYGVMYYDGDDAE